MGFNLEIQFYNSFWIKKTTTPIQLFQKRGDAAIPSDEKPEPDNALDTSYGYVSVFPGLPHEKNNLPISDGVLNFPNWPKENTLINPPYDNVQPFISNVNVINNSSFLRDLGTNWIIEESRIRGGFNNNQVDVGTRAYLKEDSNGVKHRENALIYSGIYNSRTEINNTNVFSIGEDITKAVDPHNGSVQLIYAMDNNLTIFQENKISTALIDKDQVFSAEGQPLTTSSNVVIGQITPYSGDFGISKNPESFAAWGFRRYFSDKNRNSVLRLSRDGLTKISDYGMKDYFRDEFSKVKEIKSVTTQPYKILFNSTTALISAGLIPGTEGFFVSLAKNISNEGIIPGASVEINYDLAGGGSWQSLNNTVISTGKALSNIGHLDCVFLNDDLTLQNFLIGGDPHLRFTTIVKEYIKGGYDNYKDAYVISIQRSSGSKSTDEISDYSTDYIEDDVIVYIEDVYDSRSNAGYYSTLSFDEKVKGWTSFYTYRPDLMFSMKNNYYTTKGNNLYKHYEETSTPNTFYNAQSRSCIEFIFNDSPSLNKNFKTVEYEGNSGWQVDSFSSDSFDSQIAYENIDTSNLIRSYEEGLYTEKGIPYRIGFNRKNNKYYSNIVNNSPAASGEINFGPSMTGIKGFFAIVKMSTDLTTKPGRAKELFCVSTNFTPSR
tara:strand:- start:10507 stop:12489 length:1983 start_codon:yes stop_codon:yes gene_type:complete